MLKQEFIRIYREVMKENSLTYKDMCELSGMSSSQMANILKHGAAKVSVEKMETGLTKLGFGFELLPFNLED